MLLFFYCLIVCSYHSVLPPQLLVLDSSSLRLVSDMAGSLLWCHTGVILVIGWKHKSLFLRFKNLSTVNVNKHFWEFWVDLRLDFCLHFITVSRAFSSTVCTVHLSWSRSVWSWLTHSLTYTIMLPPETAGLQIESHWTVYISTNRLRRPRVC